MSDLQNKRFSDESQKQYKARREGVKAYLKEKKKGLLVWNSKRQGTYYNPMRKPICCLN